MDRQFIAFSGLFLIINTLVNQTISSFLIQRTNWIKLESSEESGEAQEFNEGNDQIQGVMKGFVNCWDGLKQFFIDFHVDHLTPFLVDE